MSFDILTHTLVSNVNDDGTFTLAYPNNRNSGDYLTNGDHRIGLNRQATLKSRGGQFSVTFGTTNITVTNLTGKALLAGTQMTIQLDRLGAEATRNPASSRVVPLDTHVINLGAPDVADPNGVCETQAITAAGTGTINGALAAGGVATFDTPRNVVAAWTGTAVLTVTGEDEFGNVMVESSASGTSMAGKKAFKKVTAVAVSANVTAATVGTGDVLGLPVFLPGAGYVVGELQDGAKATAGTLVAGVAAVATATTGDVRGTYDPNAAADGSKAFALIAVLPDPGDKGVPQFAG